MALRSETRAEAKGKRISCQIEEDGDTADSTPLWLERNNTQRRQGEFSRIGVSMGFDFLGHHAAEIADIAAAINR